MTPMKKHLSVVIASPGDVKPERDLIAATLDDLNRGIAGELGYHIDCRRWETDVYPQFHPHGTQGAIDKALRIQDCDILVGIFWSRFGTPVADARSGTEHEFRLAYEAWQMRERPVIMLYFKTEPFTAKTVEDAEQLKRVLEFKSTLPQEAVYGDVDDIEAFGKRLLNDLTQLLRQNFKLRGAVQPLAAPPAQRAPNNEWEQFELSQLPLYTFCGLHRETQRTATFQDFRIDRQRYANPNPVTHLWADVYRGCTITAAVEEAEPPHLSVAFENKPSSWPSNLTLRPVGEHAVVVGDHVNLTFEARVDSDASSAGTLAEVAMGVRVINGWFQHWAFGPGPGRYRLFYITDEWQSITVPLNGDSWWLFTSDGNHYFGPPKVDLDIIAGVVLELGSDSIDRPGPGRARVNLRGMHLT